MSAPLTDAVDLGFPKELPPALRWPDGPTQWCWALVTASIVRHYAAKGSARASIAPRDVVESVLGLSPDARPEAMDRPARLEVALAHYGHLRYGPTPWLPSQCEIIAELQAKRPVAVGLYWASQPLDTVGHFVVVVGAKSPDGLLVVWDPRYGFVEATRDELAVAYPHNGRGVTAYYTKP